MESIEVLIAALRALCEREGGHRVVADEANISADNLWQILHGIKLPSGKPRGIGSRLASKLDKRYPGWMNLQPLSEGLKQYPVAQEVSPRPYNSPPMPVHLVPVIGTLAMGEEKMHQLRSLEGGQPIGHVPAYSERPGSYAVQVKGDDLYPAVRHGSCLVIDPDGVAVEGELALLETKDGDFLVCELVANRPDTIIVMPANGGQRRTFSRAEVGACMPVCDVIPGHRMHATAAATGEPAPPT